MCLLGTQSSGSQADAHDGISRAQGGVRVWVPLDSAAMGPEHAAVQSTAAYRLVPSQTCPPGTWRWASDSAARWVEFDVASALVVRVERIEDSAATEGDDALAGEVIAEAFRMSTGLDPDRGSDLAVRFDANVDPVEALREAWFAHAPERLARARAALATMHDSAGVAGDVRLTAIVARERVRAECLPVEVCDGGAWRPEGHRARAIKRTPEAPRFFPVAAKPAAREDTALDPNTEAAVDDDDPLAELFAWLQEHYVAEAAAGAVLADGGDPCLVSFAVGIAEPVQSVPLARVP
ncbi:hypothetical protein ASA1KI_09250 [Opitutales bacterium ASA1]|nr:hypothetical protein ASA1KI_09250 [Opitutales bacterium ASA1]